MACSTLALGSPHGAPVTPMAQHAVQREVRRDTHPQPRLAQAMQAAKMPPPAPNHPPRELAWIDRMQAPAAMDRGGKSGTVNGSAF